MAMHPDVDALWALAQRDVASVEVKAHLETCDACRSRLAEVRATQALLPSRTPLSPVPELPEAAWSRIDSRVLAAAEEALSRPLPEDRKGTRLLRWATPIAALAAAVVLVVLWSSRAPTEIQGASEEGSVAVVESVEARVGEDTVPVAQRLGPGQRVRTGTRGRLALSFADGSKAVVGPQSEVSLVTLTPALSTVALEFGRLEVEAVHRPEREWRVVAGAVEVVDVGTAFVVERDGAGVRVAVSEGEVEARSPEKRVKLVAGEEGIFEGRSVRVQSASSPAPPPAPLAPTKRASPSRNESPREERDFTSDATTSTSPGEPSAERLGEGEGAGQPLSAENDTAATTAEASPSVEAPATASERGGGHTSAPAVEEPEKGTLEKLRRHIRPPFAPLGSSRQEARAREVERLADEGSCGLAVTRAEDWLRDFPPADRASGRAAQLRRMVRGAQARCLQKLGRTEEAQRAREDLP